MSSHERVAIHEFADSDLRRELQNWVYSAPAPAAEMRERILRRAAALRWMVHGESWRAWIFAFGRLTPDQNHSSSSYLMWTYQTASIRLVI